MPFNEFPYISILLAVRDEEVNIIRCLESLNKLSYPSDRLEILIGNDLSTDLTEELINTYISDKPSFQLHNIYHQEADLRGKANVLAQLARKAKGEYYFFCDADIAVKPDWIQNMLKNFTPKTGVVNGITIMDSKGLYSDLQSLEWLFALGSFRLLYFLNIPITSMGNNMAIRAKAYHATGGYETVGFSVVEDYTLFKAILNKGYSFNQCFEQGVISTSVPVANLRSQLIQRKRWMQGAMQVPFWIIALFFIGAVFPWICITMIPLFGEFTLWLLMLCYLTITFLTAIPIYILREFRLFKSLPFFGFYIALMNLLSLISYFKPGKVVWKDRQY